MPGGSPLQLHAAQQLILGGNIHGTNDACKAEADHRIKHLQDKAKSLTGQPVDWHDAVEELGDLSSEPLEPKISEYTFLQLANAAKRSHDAGGVQPPPQPPIAGAEAVARWMGWDGV